MSKLLKSLAWLAVLGFPITLVLYHTGLIHFGQSFKLLMATGVLAAVVFVVALILRVLKRNDAQIVNAAHLAMVLSIIPLVGLGLQAKKGRSVPEIHNISTDTVNPPQFNKIVALRGESSNSLEYDASVLAQVQEQAYPEVKTAVLNDAPQNVFAKAVSLVKTQGWELVNADEDALVIEATDTTLLWQFKDDVVIRIRPTAQGGSKIDMRSVSRIGRSDLGANAARISEFLNQLSN